MSKENLKLSMMSDEERAIYLASRIKEGDRQPMHVSGFMKFIEDLKGQDGYTPVKGKDYFTNEEIRQIIHQVTPVKGQDYFTDREIANFRKSVTPIKNIDYFDGKDGQDGKDADISEVVSEVFKLIPTSVKDSPNELAAKLNTLEEAISYKVLKDIPKSFGITVEDVIKELQKKQYLEPKNIKGMPINFNDMRWHGSGLSKTDLPVFKTNGVLNGNQKLLNLIAGTNITLTNTGGDVTIDSTGGGGGGVVFVTYSELATLMSTDSVAIGTQYFITDRADLGIIVTGTAVNKVSLQGMAGFLNADFNQVGDYSDVAGFVQTAGQWDIQTGILDLDDSTGFIYGDSVTSSSGGSGTIYQTDGGNIYIKNINGIFANGDTITDTNSAAVTTATADITLFTPFTTGYVVVEQDQNDNRRWKNWMKITDDPFSDRPENASDRWQELPRSTTTGYIEEWDYIEYSFDFDCITQRNDRYGNKITIDQYSGNNHTFYGFPFGNYNVEGNVFGEYSQYAILRPIDYFAQNSAPTGWFDLYADSAYFDVFESEFMADTFLYLTTDYNNSVDVDGLRMGAESGIYLQGDYTGGGNIEPATIGPRVTIHTATFSIHRGSQVMGGDDMDITLTEDLDADQLTTDPTKPLGIVNLQTLNAAGLPDIQTITSTGDVSNLTNRKLIELIDTTGGDVTRTLPIVADAIAKEFNFVRRDDSGNLCRIKGGFIGVASTFTPGGSFNIDFLVVGAGGGGGASRGGGGGAGGLIYETAYGVSPSIYTILVGAGGDGAFYDGSFHAGSNGEDSSFDSNISIGGGQGSSDGNSLPATSGGSGGAGNPPGTGTVGQGNDGGLTQLTPNYEAAGGGGADTVGGAVSAGFCGNGGDGLPISITGSSVYYAGGGAGAEIGGLSVSGTGGLGGGGNGGTNPTVIGQSGTDGLGGGGGGGANDTGGVGAGGRGGDGVVILRMLTSDYMTSTQVGATVTTDGSYTILTYDVTAGVQQTINGQPWVDILNQDSAFTIVPDKNNGSDWAIISSNID